MEEHRQRRKLLEKYATGRCSTEELRQLYQSLKASGNDEAYRDIMDQLWEQLPSDRTLPDQRAEALLESVLHTAPKLSVKYWYRIAATMTGFLLIACILYLAWEPNGGTHQYATEYGQMKTLWLPDSSQVTLNANSSLTYRRTHPDVREVWLQGEAFFEVREMITEGVAPQSVRFQVHTPNLTVAVLGTSFNVNNRRGTTQVVLKSGKVRLDTKNNDQLTMQPGELVELSAESRALTTQVVNPDEYTEWRENKLVFKRTPIHEVAQRIEDYYGVEVVLMGDGWASRKITGSIPTDSQGIFLEILAESMSIDITQQGNRILLSNTSHPGD